MLERLDTQQRESEEMLKLPRLSDYIDRAKMKLTVRNFDMLMRVIEVIFLVVAIFFWASAVGPNRARTVHERVLRSHVYETLTRPYPTNETSDGAPGRRRLYESIESDGHLIHFTEPSMANQDDHRPLTSPAYLMEGRERGQDADALSMFDVRSNETFLLWLEGPFVQFIEEVTEPNRLNRASFALLGQLQLQAVDIARKATEEVTVQDRLEDLEECTDVYTKMEKSFTSAFGGAAFPACQPPYTWHRINIEPKIRAARDAADWKKGPAGALPAAGGDSYGLLGRYDSGGDGDTRHVAVDDIATLRNDLASLRAGWLTADTRLVKVSFILYNPSVDAILSCYVNLEINVAGSAVTQVQLLPIAVSSYILVAQDHVLFAFAILWALVVIAMEGRRILRPRYDTEKEKLSVWTFLFLSIPIMIIVSFAIRTTWAADHINDSVLDGLEAYDSFDYFYRLRNASHIADSILLLLFMGAMVRYSLFYFSQLQALRSTVAKLRAPLLVAIILLAGFVIASSAVFYTHQSQHRADGAFASRLLTLLTTLWDRSRGMISLRQHSFLTLVEVVCIFVGFITLFRSLQVAVIASCLKEYRLHRYSFIHPLWTHLMTLHKTTPDNIDPSRPLQDSD